MSTSFTIHTIQQYFAFLIKTKLILYSQVRNFITQLTLAFRINHLLLWRHLLGSFYNSVMAVKKFLGDRYGIDDLGEISKKIQCFKDFLDVMSKVDPGYSTVNVHFLLIRFSNQFWNCKSRYFSQHLFFVLICVQIT